MIIFKHVYRAGNLRVPSHLHLGWAHSGAPLHIFMPSPYQGQSTAKTAFLLSSAVGWLIVGASLIYLVPFALNLFRPSELTGTWMATLARSGYNPMLAIGGGGIALVATTLGNWIWYQNFEGKA